MYIHTCIYLSISLSLYIYIYIYIPIPIYHMYTLRASFLLMGISHLQNKGWPRVELRDFPIIVLVNT